jgi:hypothetical protein
VLNLFSASICKAFVFSNSSFANSINLARVCAEFAVAKNALTVLTLSSSN